MEAVSIVVDRKMSRSYFGWRSKRSKNREKRMEKIQKNVKGYFNCGVGRGSDGIALRTVID